MALNITGPLGLRVNVTIGSITSPLTPSNAFDEYCATAQAGDLTINAPTGTPANGDKLLFRIKSNGVATRTITLTTGSNGAFRAVGTTIPVDIAASKTCYIGCIYNAEDQRWDVIAIGTEA
jgi:hypothetical protein